MAAGFGRIGGILGPLLVGYLVARGTEISMIFLIFCVAVVAAVAAIFFLGTETKQKELA